ncbi:MAG: glycoside hydrolase family 15 protein [Geminicoccaceae bacterium]
MTRAIGATDLVRLRPGLGQSITPSPGSVLASPVPGDWDPEPDYFFDWLRDGAIVMDAALVCLRRAETDDVREVWNRRFHGYVAFGLKVTGLRGSDLLAAGDPAAKATPQFRQFVRPPGELAHIDGDTVRGDVRYNPDGTLDILRWSRPQHDGAALRAITLQRYAAAVRELDLPLAPGWGELLAGDLDYTEKHFATQSYDLWEERLGMHPFTILVQRAAVSVAGREVPVIAIDEPERPDIARVLAALHTDSSNDPVAVDVARKLAAHFAEALPINRCRPEGVGPVIGRYPGDQYFDGGAWFVATLAVAELAYRRGEMDLGDSFLAAVRRFVGAEGEMSEQIDPVTGDQRSARHLTWSYAAFVTAAAARRRALAARGS